MRTARLYLAAKALSLCLMASPAYAIHLAAPAYAAPVVAAASLPAA